MRKIFLPAAVLLSVSVLFSCTRENSPAGIPDVVKDMEFTSLNDGVGAKTTLDGTVVKWESTDRIAVFSAAEPQEFAASYLSEDKTSATFTGQAVVADTYYAVYPYDASATNASGVITATLPAEQTFAEGSFSSGANLSAAKTSGTQFQFKNVGGLVSFKVEQEGVTSISLSADEDMAGKVQIDLTGETPSVTSVVEGSKSVTLTGDFVSGSTYYFCVLPGTYTNIKVGVNTASGNITLSNSKPLTVARKTVTPVGKLAAKLAAPAVTFNQCTFAENRAKTYSTVSWEPVSNATGYIVKLDGTEIAYSGTSASLGYGNGAHTVTVQAVNTELPGLYTDSNVASLDINMIEYGGGTEKTPWMIYTAADWNSFAADACSHSYSSKFVKVMNDIDFKDVAVTGAGLNSTKNFAGTFDGNGKTFSNLAMGSSSATTAGLFICLSGTVKNLIVDKATVTMATAAGNTTKGSVICGGDTAGSVENVTVKNSSITSRGYASMIVGSKNSTVTTGSHITGCVVDNCTMTGNDATSGAIAAYFNQSNSYIADCVVKNCTFTNVKAMVGGIVGACGTGATSCYIANCQSIGNDITSKANTGTGALVGCINVAMNIVNNKTAGCKMRNTTTKSEVYMSLLLGKEGADGGKIQNNVVASGEIYHAVTSKPRIGFFVGTKGSGKWNINYYDDALVNTANKSTGDQIAPIGLPSWPGATTGGSTPVGDSATLSGPAAVKLADLVTTLNGNITKQGYKTDFPAVRDWTTGEDGWPTFEY